MRSAPQPLLRNGAVNTPKTIWNNRWYYPWGPCKVIIEENSNEQSRVESPACRDMILESELAAAE
jgi:hypothetical protein